jgi:hypothetical protein
MSNNQDSLPQADDGVLLCGLDGTNPLGFLAALGAFRLLAIENACVKMSWQLFSGTWRPTLFGIRVPLAQLGTELRTAIDKLDQSVWSIDKKLPFAAVRFRQEARNAVHAASSTSRNLADAIASLGVECLPDKDGDFEVTSLCMVRSGDSKGQGLLAYGKRIIESTTWQQLQQAVVSEWLHEDDQCALRWDPAEDRSYALQWRNPSKVGALSMKGGNCLALFGMPMFTTVPFRREAETTAFGLREPKKSSLSWPIWKHPVSLDMAISLLGLSDIQRAQPPRTELESRGIASVYRCDRIMTSTYYANFTPARRVA